jgi:hypothetical protein
MGAMHTPTLLSLSTLFTRRVANWAGPRCLAMALAAAACGWGPGTAAEAPIGPPPAPTLTLQIEGQGAVVSAEHLLCNTPTCSTVIPQGTVVQLTATPTSGWRFAGWGGACSRRTRSGAVAATAQFVRDIAPVGCAVPSGKAGATPVIAATHPKVLLGHAATLDCLKRLRANHDETYRRFREFVDLELAGGPEKETQYGFETWHAALLWQVTGYPEYRDFAIARADKFVREEEALIASGKAPSAAKGWYLYAGHYLGGLALVYDWCFDALTASQKVRWLNYMNQGVYNVWHEQDSRWGNKAFPWSGWANTDPYNNYHYSFLQATMLVGLATSGDNPQAATWLRTFREDKLGRELVPQFNRTLYSGGSLEGTNYGVSLKELFKVYLWWERSTGERIADLTPHTLGSLGWMMHQVVPTTEWLINLGDQSRDANAYFFDYNREFMLALIALYPQERMSAAANEMLRASTLPAASYHWGSVWDFLYKAPPLPEARLTDVATTWYGVGTGDLFMRAAWADPTAAMASFKCGWLIESHQHWEQGAFQLFRGEWLAPTANRFSRSGLEPNIESNNMAWFKDPATGKAVQQTDRVGTPSTCEMTALADQALYTYAVARVTPVYHDHPLIASQEREFVFIKPSTFVVLDRMVAKSAKVPRVWTVHMEKPSAVADGDHLHYQTERGNSMDIFHVAPAGLRFQVAPELFAPDGLALERHPQPRRADVVDAADSPRSVFLHVIATTAAGGVSSVRSVEASPAPGQTGARITLADGRVATLRFGNEQAGGSLAISSPDGEVLSSGPLPHTVTIPPLFRP